MQTTPIFLRAKLASLAAAPTPSPAAVVLAVTMNSAEDRRRQPASDDDDDSDGRSDDSDGRRNGVRRKQKREMKAVQVDEFGRHLGLRGAVVRGRHSQSRRSRSRSRSPSPRRRSTSRSPTRRQHRSRHSHSRSRSRSPSRHHYRRHRHRHSHSRSRSCSPQESSAVGSASADSAHRSRGGKRQGWRPPRAPLNTGGEPKDWIVEGLPDGAVRYRNVRTLWVSMTRPKAWEGLDEDPVTPWEASLTAEGNTLYTHTDTGEVVEGWRKTAAWGSFRSDSRAGGGSASGMGSRRMLTEKDLATGRIVVELNHEDKKFRFGKNSTQVSMHDRQLVYSRLAFRPRAKGGADIIGLHSKSVVCALSPEDRAIYEANPHIRQVFINGRSFLRSEAPFELDNRLVSPDLFPRMTYMRRFSEANTIEHWNRRQTIFAAFEFLTMYGHLAETVVYVGGYPGSHIKTLVTKLFPQHKFILVDQHRYVEVPDLERVERFEKTTIEDVTATLVGRGISFLLVCEMATSEPGKDLALDRALLARQKAVVAALRPVAALLHFRLPYFVVGKSEATDTTEYFAGELYLPVWGARTATECRLVVTDPVQALSSLVFNLTLCGLQDSTHCYNHKDFEEFMFKFNTSVRTTYFEMPVTGEGLDHCFDCASEVCVLREYRKRFGGSAHGDDADDEGAVAADILELSQLLTIGCGSSRDTLAVDLTHPVLDDDT